MLNKLFIIFFITSAVWGTAIDGIPIPMLGTLFPLRIAVLLFGVILLFRTYVLKEDIVLYHGSPRPTKILRNVTSATLIIMMICALMTLYWAYSSKRVIVDMIVWITSFMCIFMSLSFIKTKEDVILASRIFVINILIIGGIGIYESFTGDYFDLSYEYYLRQKNMFGLYKPASIMFNINNLSILLALSMPIAFIATTGMKGKLFWDFLLMAFAEFITVLTGCNTGLIILCVVLGMYLYMNRGKTSSLLLVIVVALIIIALGSMIGDIFSEIINFQAKNEPRFDIWRNSVAVAWRYKFMGVGPGNSLVVNDLYKVTKTAVVSLSHNYLLTVFEEFGIIAFGFFVWWLIRLIYSLVDTYLKDKNDMIKYAIMFLIIFFPSSLCMSNMVGFYFYWAEIGIFMAYNEILENERYEKEELEKRKQEAEEFFDFDEVPEELLETEAILK